MTPDTMRRIGLILSLAALLISVAAVILSAYAVARDDDGGQPACNPYAKSCKPVEQAPPADYKRERVTK